MKGDCELQIGKKVLALIREVIRNTHKRLAIRWWCRKESYVPLPTVSRLVTASATMDEAFSFDEGIVILVSPVGAEL
jgi:hypothetical protein